MSGSIGDFFGGIQSVGNQFANVNSLQSFADATTSLSDLLSGPPVLSLGKFKFVDFEVPENIEYTTQNQIVEHKMPGGTKQIDDLGPDPTDISFSGIFLGSNQQTRRAALEQIRTQGVIVPLIWQDQYRDVFVKNIKYTAKGGMTNFTVECLVIPSTPPKPKTSLLGAITNSLSNALGVDIPAALSNVQTVLGNITPLVQQAVNLTGGSKGALGILGAVGSANNIVGGLNLVANGSIGGITQIATSITSSGSAISAISTLTKAFGNATTTSRIGNNLTVMQANLQVQGSH